MAKQQTSPQTPVTLQMIADRCGVALSTVSIALRGSSKVKPKTLERILAVAQEVGYDPAQHEMARRLAMKRHGTRPLNRTIASIFPPDSLRASYFMAIYQGIMEKAQAECFDVLTIDIHRLMQLQDPSTFSPFFRRGEIDGVVLCGAFFTGPVARMLRAIPGFGARPVCTLFMPTAGATCIKADDTQGVYLATQHLLGLGHREICLFVNPGRDDTTSLRRIAGATRAYEEHGLDAQQLLHQIVTFGSWYNPIAVPHDPNSHVAIVAEALQAREQFQQFLAEHRGITAVIGINDACALHAWYACTAAGRRVPDDISIIGFDDTDSMPGMLGENLLTTVHVPLYEAGVQAAESLLHMIEHGTETPETITLPTSLVARASTAAAPQRLTAR